MSKKNKHKSGRDMTAPAAPKDAQGVQAEQHDLEKDQPTSIGQWVEVVLAVLIIGGGVAWLMHTQALRGKAMPPAARATAQRQNNAVKNSAAAQGRGSPRMGTTPVAVAAAQKGNIPVTLSALGTVTPLASVTVQPQIAGTLMKLDFKEGETVKKGAALALIDPRPYQAMLAQYQGQLERDTALLDNAKRDLARYNRLLREDSISRQQRDGQRALVKQYEGTVATDKAQIDNAKLDISYCHITAPIGGRVGLRQVDAGNYVSLNTAGGIVTITQMQPTSVLFSLPQDDLPGIMKRLNAGAKLPVAALDRNQDATLAQGTLETVDNAIDASTGTIRMRALFANKTGALFGGQFVNVKLLLDTLQNVIVIPEAAVRTGAPGAFVYVVKPDETVAVAPITTGPSAGGDVAVLKGLQAGDTVVTEGADKLKDGAKVTVPSRGGPL